MTTSLLLWTQIEKAAVDNGFDIDGAKVDEWRIRRSSQTKLEIWLTHRAPDQFHAAFSRWDIFDALSELNAPVANRELPTGAAGARRVTTISDLHALLRRAFQLARSLPDEPLKMFQQQTAHMPATTEIERLTIERIGQDIFRNGLLDYWEGRCAVTGLDVPALLRASHIKPWAACTLDEERLDVFNGFLLAPQLDLAFDLGFITFDDEGNVALSKSFPPNARRILVIDDQTKLQRMDVRHRRYLQWHRENVWRG